MDQKHSFIERFFINKIFNPLNDIYNNLNNLSVKEVNENVERIESFYKNIIEYMNINNIRLDVYKNIVYNYYNLRDSIKKKNHSLFRILKDFLK